MKRLFATLFLLSFLFGCGATWKDNVAKSLEATHIAVKGASDVVEPIWRKKCRAAVDECKKKNDKVCKPWIECSKERHNINLTIKNIHRSIQAMLSILPVIESAVKTFGGDK